MAQAVPDRVLVVHLGQVPVQLRVVLRPERGGEHRAPVVAGVRRRALPPEDPDLPVAVSAMVRIADGVKYTSPSRMTVRSLVDQRSRVDAYSLG